MSLNLILRQQDLIRNWIKEGLLNNYQVTLPVQTIIHHTPCIHQLQSATQFWRTPLIYASCFNTRIMTLDNLPDLPAYHGLLGSINKPAVWPLDFPLWTIKWTCINLLGQASGLRTFLLLRTDPRGFRTRRLL